MNFGLSAALRGLPALAGVLVGVYLLAAAPVSWALGMPLIALLFLALLLGIAARVFNERPLLGLTLLEPWSLAAVAIVAACTSIVLWLTINLESALGLPAAEAKAVSGALVGAFTTFAATAWLKEIQESNGAFVASAQAKQFFKAFAAHHKITGDNVIFDACYSDKVSVSNGSLEGWGLSARWKRGMLLRKFLKQGKVPPPR